MSNLHEFRLPDLGDFKEVPVVELLVSPGDLVAADDLVLVLESDKATLEVPVDVAGRVAEIRVAPGDRVSAGMVVLLIEAEGAAADAAPAPAAPAAQPAPAQVPASAPTTAPVPAPPPAPAAAPAPAAPGKLPHASPSVRKTARELGVDLAAVVGTGPKGRITPEDVRAFVKQALSAPAAQGAGLDLAPWPQHDPAAFGPVERQPLSRIARLSGPALQRNAVIIPHVTNFDEADVTDLDTFRKALAAEGAGKFSLLPFAVKAAAATLKAFPAFNATLDGTDLILRRYVNIGVAADTPEGLVVPVIRDADKKSLTEIAAEMADLATAARAGKLKAQQMQGAGFTISSLGGVGGTGFTPIINAPEVAILGMARAAIKPVWDGAAFQPRLIQPLSLSWDHRVVDGVAAARFLVHLKALLADFRRISL